MLVVYRQPFKGSDNFNCVAPPADPPLMTMPLGIEDVAAAAYTCSVAVG